MIIPSRGNEVQPSTASINLCVESWAILHFDICEHKKHAMDQPLWLQPSGDLPHIDWGNNQQSNFQSTQNCPLPLDSAASNVTSSLSASYLLPEPSILQGTKRGGQLSMPRGVFSENHSSENQTKSTTPDSTTHRKLNRRRREPKTTALSTKKRRNPREKVGSPPEENPEEVSRLLLFNFD